MKKHLLYYYVKMDIEDIVHIICTYLSTRDLYNGPLLCNSLWYENARRVIKPISLIQFMESKTSYTPEALQCLLEYDVDINDNNCAALIYIYAGVCISHHSII